MITGTPENFTSVIELYFSESYVAGCDCFDLSASSLSNVSTHDVEI